MGRTQTSRHIVPIALAPRERTSFDADWLFHLGDVETGQVQALDARRWRKLDLPHDWSIEGSISEDNPAGPAGGFFPGGIGWYRKQFIASAAWAGRKVAIEFDGIY
jgi:beta-galactosidase